MKRTRKPAKGVKKSARKSVKKAPAKKKSGRAKGSTPAKLSRLKPRHPSRAFVPYVMIETRPIDASAYGISEKDAARGTELHLVISGPGADAMAEQMQSTGGSYWESDGPNFAYNIVTVWSEAEYKEIIRELKNDGARVQVVDYMPRSSYGETLSLRETLKRRRHERAGEMRPRRSR